MLTLENVSLNYGSFTALNGVSLHAGQGELVVLLGANGAGKSSIFLTISGIHKAAGGSIRYGDKSLVGMKPSQIVANGVVQCPEGRKLFPGMSVLKNLMLGAYVHRGDGAANRQRLEEVMALFPILDQKKDDPAGSLSGGSGRYPNECRRACGRSPERAAVNRSLWASVGICVDLYQAASGKRQAASSKSKVESRKQICFCL